MWKPFAARAPRPPCEACGSKNYHQPFNNAEGYIVCNLDCYYAMKWRKKFLHLVPVTTDPKYQHQKGRTR